MFTVGIVTLSDKGAAGNREDLSGVKIKEMLPDDLYQVLSYRILPDEQKEIEQELVLSLIHIYCGKYIRRCTRKIRQSMHIGPEKLQQS